MNIKELFHSSWYPVVNLLYQEPLKTLSEEILPNISFQPKKENIFRVFQMPVQDINVVILGQDPYPTPGDAIGYSFATTEERIIPKSLGIIQNEIIREGLPTYYPKEDGHYADNWKELKHWTDQGVFLLNTALTVQTGKAGSHLKYWNDFTIRVIQHISSTNPCIWLLWGKKAQNFIPNIVNSSFKVTGYDKNTINEIPSNIDWNYILTAPHPAAELYSGGKAGFYGCNHFTFTNTILQKVKSKTINW